MKLGFLKLLSLFVCMATKKKKSHCVVSAIIVSSFFEEWNEIRIHRTSFISLDACWHTPWHARTQCHTQSHIDSYGTLWNDESCCRSKQEREPWTVSYSTQSATVHQSCRSKVLSSRALMNIWTPNMTWWLNQGSTQDCVSSSIAVHSMPTVCRPGKGLRKTSVPSERLLGKCRGDLCLLNDLAVVC